MIYGQIDDTYYLLISSELIQNTDENMTLFPNEILKNTSAGIEYYFSIPITMDPCLPGYLYTKIANSF